MCFQVFKVNNINMGKREREDKHIKYSVLLHKLIGSEQVHTSGADVLRMSTLGRLVTKLSAPDSICAQFYDHCFSQILCFVLFLEKLENQISSNLVIPHIQSSALMLSGSPVGHECLHLRSILTKLEHSPIKS